MNKRPLSPLTEVLVIGGIIIVQVLVILSGHSAYEKLNGIIEYVRVPEEGQEEMIHLRGIVSDISRAEHFAKAYHLTGNQEYLKGYYETAAELGHRVDILNYTPRSDWKEKTYVEEIVVLTEKTLRIYNRIIELENNEQITDLLSSISSISSGQSDKSLSANQKPAQPEKSGTFFQKLFGRKSPASPDIQAGKVSATDSVNIIRQDVQRQVKQVETVQKDELRKLKRQELALAEKSVVTSDRIFLLVARMEELERAKIQQRNDRAEELANESRKALLSFGILIILLLCVTAYFTVKYILSSHRMKLVLNTEKEQAQMLAEARQNLLAHMSHEIRTPLNSVIGFLEQVLDSELTDQQREQIVIAKKSSDHLLSIINNILESSKLKSGKIKFAEVVFQPNLLLAEIVKSMNVQAQAKNLKMEFHSEGHIPDHVIGDPLRLKQVVLNIIGNAIKYTEHGYVKLTVRAADQKLILEIEDTGEGIPEENIGSIFDQYEQLHADGVQPGTGLGLHITRGLVESQGGTIHIRSEVGKGTMVTLVIPYREVDSPDEISPAPALPLADISVLQDKVVLIADDEKYNRLLLSSILKKNNIRFYEASNGVEALEAVKKENIDIVLMDVRMPEVNGLDATRSIRRLDDPQKSHIPIIALTAGLASEKLERCREAGMNDFLEKPFRESVLLEKMAALLHSTQKQDHD